jgi:riboflavin biosynthesis pyrimidine reductase
MFDPESILRLYPEPPDRIPLKGLYLEADGPAPPQDSEGPFVYANYIVSLDGRIAVEDPATGRYGVPKPIANPRDWRLYQELAAQADTVVISGRYLRDLARGTAQAPIPLSEEAEFDDLRTWRSRRGMARQPAIVVLSASLDLPLAQVLGPSGRTVIVATGATQPAERIVALEQAGALVLRVGRGPAVEGAPLMGALAALGHHRVYVAAGPQILETLLRDRRVDRLYLTFRHRLLGGERYDTLLTGAALVPPVDFHLTSLHYDPEGERGPGQLFAVYDAAPGSRT